MVDRLPQEIVDIIVKELPGRRDLNALCQVSRAFYKACLPLLYESFVFYIGEGPRDYLNIWPAYSNVRTNLHLIRDVRFVSAFRHSLEWHCPHNYGTWMIEDDFPVDPDLDLLDTQSPAFGTQGFDRFEARLEPIFEQLGKHGLRTFSWEVGTCIPQRLLQSPWITQDQLQHLSLIKDGACSMAISTARLQGPKNLQTFSWQGLPNGDDLIHLKGCLKNNANRLSTLSLNFVSWQKLIRNWFQAVRRKHPASSWLQEEAPNLFAVNTLSLQPKTFKTFFPRLTRLSLSCVSFESWPAELACAFNLSNLRHLSLWNCPGTGDLLTELVKREHKINLLSFALTITYFKEHGLYPEHFRKVGNFLGAFHGLRDVFLMLTSEWDECNFCLDWDPVITGLKSHADSLERLVCHERFQFGPYDEDVSWDGILDDFLQNPKLRCLGLSCRTTHTIIGFDSLGFEPTFEILHIRASRDTDERRPSEDFYPQDRPDWCYCTSLLDVWTSMYPSPQAPPDRESDMVPRDLLSLAQMAFGPTGLPNLRLIAWGDFSYNGRYEEYTRLFCKSDASTVRSEDIDNNSFYASEPEDLTFRQVTEYDTDLIELFQREHDMLSACPVDNIVGRKEDKIDV